MKKSSTHSLLRKSLVIGTIFSSVTASFANAMDKEGEGSDQRPPVVRTSPTPTTSQPDLPPPYPHDERPFGTVVASALPPEALEAEERARLLQQQLAEVQLQLAERNKQDAEDRADRERRLREDAEARERQAQQDRRDAEERAARQQQETAAQMAALAAQMEALRTQQQQQPADAPRPIQQIIRPQPEEKQGINGALGDMFGGDLEKFLNGPGRKIEKGVSDFFKGKKK